MSARSLLTTTLLLVVASVTAVAAPVNFVENWEAYEDGGIPGGPWYVDPHFPDGGLTVIEGEIYNRTYGGSKSLLINNTGFNGKDAGIQAKLVQGGFEVQATDANKLSVEYYAKGDISQHSEWYLEVSFGDVHAPRLIDIGYDNPLPVPIPVIAWCKPFIERYANHKGCYFFDGQRWRFYGYLDWDDLFGWFLLRIGTDTMYMQCSCQNNPATVPRLYLGTFDRVSIYTRDAEYQEYTVIDDIRIWGGDVINSLTVSPADTFVSIGPVGGAFSPDCRTYTLTNITSLPLDWTATKTYDWLNLSAVSGTLAASASTTVDVCINANANALPQGLHTDAVVFNDLTNNMNQFRNVELYVGQIDSFTEQFDGNNDLDNLSVMLTPDDSPHQYSACLVPASQFPTPPAGGTNLALTGDTFVKVTLAQGAMVSLYDEPYSDFYVGSNGYITFIAGDVLATGTTVNHFKKRRIAGLFTDLAPQTGQISYKQLMDRVAVTYQNVVVAGTSDANSFQIEMFYDGRIRLTWLGIATNSGLVGLSRGLGIPTNFHFSDFSAYDPCTLVSYKGDFDDDGDIDQSDFGSMQLCYASLPGLIVDPDCADADMDLDGIVGLLDVAAFSNCFSGPNTTPSPMCAKFGALP